MMEKKELEYDKEILEIFHRDMENQKPTYKCLKKSLDGECSIEKEEEH